jgi:hypothetical protein
MIEKLDATSNIVPRSNLPKPKTRKHNDDVASRTWSKFGHTHQNLANRTRSKLKPLCNSSSKEMFFPLYDAVMLKGQKNSKNVDAPCHLGISDCLIAKLDKTPQFRVSRQHVKQLALESTGIFVRGSQGLELHTVQYNPF